MAILDHYSKEKQRFLENCVQCGLCAEECPILPYTDISEISAQDIQEGVFDLMDGGIPNHQAYTKAFACMECFKCTTDVCPEDLNPMLVNELIKGEYISAGLRKKRMVTSNNPTAFTGFWQRPGFGLGLQQNCQIQQQTACPLRFFSRLQRLLSTGENSQCPGHHGCYW